MPKRSMPGRWGDRLLRSIIPLMLAACATLPQATGSSHVYSDFTGRLIVIDTHARWQTMLDWHAAKTETGWMRITHAASSRVVELHWQGHAIWLRDNQAPSPAWRRLKPGELAAHGIPLQPDELAGFLLGKIPSGFTPNGNGAWHSQHGKTKIIVRWRGNRLSITDTTHGRRAVLVIIKRTPPRDGNG